MSENTNSDKEKVSFDNYISDEYSICREERQYALMLNNILKARLAEQSFLPKEPECAFYNEDIKKIITKCELEDVIIEKVFYEATFMRDFFERDRRLVSCVDNKEKLLNKTCSYEKKDSKYVVGFNKKLIEYVLGKGFFNVDITVIEQCMENHWYEHLGGNIQLKLENLDEYKNFFEYIKCMMNAKPDIAVLGEQSGDKVLIFLECKFESREDKYCKDKSFDIKYRGFQMSKCSTCKLEEMCKDCKNKEEVSRMAKKYCRNCENCTNCIWSQTNVQNTIGEFICDYLHGLNKDLKYKSLATKLVKFSRLPVEGEIFIKELIKLENKIWNGELWQSGIR